MRKDILAQAEKCVNGDRDVTYGKPENSFSVIARLWSVYLGGVSITPVDVALMMTLLKVARARDSPEHLDNWVDIAGYAACGGEISEEE